MPYLFALGALVFVALLSLLIRLVRKRALIEGAELGMIAMVREAGKHFGMTTEEIEETAERCRAIFKRAFRLRS